MLLSLLKQRSTMLHRAGVFATIVTEQAAEAQETGIVMIDATHARAHRAWRFKRGRRRLIGRTRGGLNPKLHVLADAKGRPIRMFLSAGQTSGYIGARALLADRRHDAGWFRNALIGTGISPCIPSRTGRKTSIPHDTGPYRLRHRIENMFARLKDWRCIGTRYDRCPILSLSACALAANVIYWL
ncbi:hypothetical protein GCM10017635_06500 [Paracoccus kondratievae]|uniref:IS5 family transposase n=1 Tax=Paracoccus kondratievae TaxID=135740 RepID=A0AAD3RSX0_9RHOB|nr:hypothetical protein GCM10017635_06500 [Paracoccus kondratievae]